MTPLALLAQLSPAVDTARALGTASSQVILGGIVVALGVVAWWLWREVTRLNAALIAAHAAAGADKERLLTVQIGREGAVVSALDAIAELPDVVRAMPEAMRVMMRDELGRTSEAPPAAKGRAR